MFQLIRFCWWHKYNCINDKFKQPLKTISARALDPNRDILNCLDLFQWLRQSLTVEETIAKLTHLGVLIPSLKSYVEKHYCQQ